MTPLQKTSIALLACITASIFSTGCASTRTENGVTIQQESSYNPMNYLPW